MSTNTGVTAYTATSIVSPPLNNTTGYAKWKNDALAINDKETIFLVKK